VLTLHVNGSERLALLCGHVTPGAVQRLRRRKQSLPTWKSNTESLVTVLTKVNYFGKIYSSYVNARMIILIKTFSYLDVVHCYMILKNLKLNRSFKLLLKSDQIQLKLLDLTCSL
jgi:hypothetical protein